MARDDDDDAVSEDTISKRRKDRDDDDEEDRPRKKSSREDKEDTSDKTAKPMPLRLVGAIIAALAWGFISLHGNCVHSSTLILQLIEASRRQREFQEQLRGFGGNMRVDMGGLEYVPYVLVGTQVFEIFLAVVLIAGGVLLLMRKGSAKYLAMGGPVGMVLVDLLGFIICLIITKGTFMVQYNVNFFISIVFSLATGGCIAFLLLNKDVSKALK